MHALHDAMPKVHHNTSACFAKRHDVLVWCTYLLSYENVTHFLMPKALCSMPGVLTTKLR